jgi:hypothetical protein
MFKSVCICICLHTNTDTAWYCPAAICLSTVTAIKPLPWLPGQRRAHAGGGWSSYGYGRERGGARPDRAQHVDAGREEYRLRARVAADTHGVLARPRVSDR